jgi:uncharacterized protein involved in propanediol utilization
VEEAAETEVAPVFEEIAARDTTTLKIAVAFEIPVTIEIVIPIGAVVQVPTVVPVAKAVAISTAEAIAVTIAVVEAVFVEVLTALFVRACLYAFMFLSARCCTGFPRRPCPGPCCSRSRSARAVC